MVAKHNFLWQFPLDFENNIFKVTFHKIFHPTAPGQIALGLYFLKGRDYALTLLFYIYISTISQCDSLENVFV